MLSELSIKNFAIIDKLTISFEKGLTVLTGETGAGKSIIIDAIHLLLEVEVQLNLFVMGKQRQRLKAYFNIDDEQHPVLAKALNLGLKLVMVWLLQDVRCQRVGKVYVESMES